MRPIFIKLTFSVIFNLVTFYNVTAQNFKYLGTFNRSGTPAYLVNPNDVISDDFKKRVQRSLPEYYAVPQYNPQYLNPNLTLDVQLNEDSDVWLTFVDEGAGYKNVVGFYTYELDKPLKKAPKIGDITIIFPNLSYEDNAVKTGNKVHLGRFPRNTGIGFALIADGFKNGLVTTGRNIFYSNPNFNPERDANKRQHSVLLRDSSGRLLLGFEDIRRDQQSDNDFNDAVFTLTTNPGTAILGNMPITVGSSIANISSGNSGGLESDGCLAEAITMRNFNRIKTPSVSADGNVISYDNPEHLQAFEAPERGGLQLRGDTELEQLIPMKPFYEPATAYLTTPKDLIGITNAQKVVAVDYFDDATQERLAAVLCTKTKNKVYDHTKVICDRLTGSTLLYTEIITIDEKPFIRSVLQREDGAIEYNISFSLATDNTGKAEMMSRWSVDEYPVKDNFCNFQIWADAPHLCQKIVEDIIVKTKDIYPNFIAAGTPQMPQVFVKKGNYDNGILTLTISNPLGASVLMLKGNQTNSETGKREDFTQTVKLKGNAEETVEIFVGSIFDMGFSIRNNKSEDYDALYVADGAWGVEYDKNVSKVENYTVHNSIPAVESGVYTIERNPTLKGQIKDYISLFRSIRPSSMVANMSAYKNLSFIASGTGIIEVMLVKKSITDWKKQYKTEIRLYDSEQNYRLPFEKFSNGTSEKFKADDLIDIVFTYKGDGKTSKPFDMSFKNVVFDQKIVKNIGKMGELAAFPNPATEITELAFELPVRGTAVVQLTNTQGRNVIERTEEFAKGSNRILLDLNHLPSGIYIASVITAKGKIATKIIIP